MRRVRLPQPNLIDKVFNYFAPVRARDRMKARAQMAVAGQWVGGRTDRRATKEWLPFGGSADEDLLDDLPNLRTRSRDLQRRNPIALGAINTDVTSIVGTGLSLRANPNAKLLRLSPEQAQEWREITEREFRVWAENPRECDATATQTFYGKQALMLRSTLESGDVLAMLPMKRVPGCIYRLKIAEAEADRLSNKDYQQDTQKLVAGVEKDDYGAPIAYHIARQHPGEIGTFRVTEWDVVPAFGQKTGRRNVIHLFEKRRPGQTRGIPYLAPVIEMLKQISDYTHAELQAALISSMFTVFVETESGDGLDLDDTGGASSGQAGSGSDIKLGAGAIVDLAKGEKINIADPKRPNAAADVFLQAMMRQLGMALQLPYEVLVKHFTASYSAARAALLEAWRFFRVQREWLATMFCQPVYEAWLDEAVALGRVIAPGYFDDPAIRAAWSGAEWIGDGPGQIDPLKEIEAAAMRIKEGLSNHTIEAMGLMGMDWLEIHDQLAREIERRKAMGTKVDQVPASPAGRGPALPAKEANDTDEETE